MDPITKASAIKTKSLAVIFTLQIILMVSMAILCLVSYTQKIDVGDFCFSLILGSLGASVALMKRIREDKVTLVAESNGFLILQNIMPILYGTIMAALAYLLFMSRILSGDQGGGLITTNIFPNFIKLPENQTLNLVQQFVEIKTIDIVDSGKLLIWSFIAGYSEKFITGILGNLESKSGN